MSKHWQNTMQVKHLYGLDMDNLDPIDATHLINRLAEHFDMAVMTWGFGDIRDRLEEAYTTDACKAQSLAHDIIETDEWRETAAAIQERHYGSGEGWAAMASTVDELAVKAGLAYGEGHDGP